MDPLVLTWIAAVVGPLITAGALLFSQHQTSRATDQREEKRLERERWLKLREERQRAYATLARVTKNMDVPDPLNVSDLAEGHSEVEMLTDDPQVSTAAEEVMKAAAEARRCTANKKKARETEGFVPPHIWEPFIEAKAKLDSCRTSFINLARKELGLKPIPSLNSPPVA